MPKDSKGPTDYSARRTPEQWREYARTKGAEPEEVRKRVLRNKARRQAIREGRVQVGDGKDIDHRIPLDAGGSNDRSNLRVRDASENRGYARDSKGNPRVPGR
jgi:5-methylcytosine-specific restriction endonuclease McrA